MLPLNIARTIQDRKLFWLLSTILILVICLAVIFTFPEAIVTTGLALFLTLFAFLQLVHFHVISTSKKLVELEKQLADSEKENASLRELNQALNDRTNRYQTLLNSIPDLAWIKDTEGRFLAVNAEFQRAFGVNYEALIGKTDFDLSRYEDAVQYREDDEEVMKSLSPIRHEFLATSVDGTRSWIELIKVPVVKEGNVVGTAGTARDISERKQAEEKLAFLAHYDMLTLVKNRYSLENDLDELIASGSRFIVAFVDLDNFKIVNDSIGHAAGDSALKAAANKLKQAIGDRGEVYRHSGDEFVVVVKEDFDQEKTQVLGRHLLDQVGMTFQVDNYEFNFSASIGLAVYPAHGDTSTELLRNADIAMYQAKISGKRRAQVFSSRFEGMTLKHWTMEKRLRRAIDNQELFLRYQPMIDSDTGEIKAMEALIRWQDPEKGEIGPADFIPFAEQSGLISEIGLYVIKVVLNQLVDWKEKGIDCKPISVNVSGIQFYHHNLLCEVESLFKETGVPANLLELELTESILMKDEDRLISTLQKFRELGLSLSVDDFGTGYSNLAYLSHYPISKLKVDRSFVTQIHMHKDKQIITRTIIELAKNLGMDVIAEGVENTSELAQVRELGCSNIQGFLYAKPLLLEEIEELLLTNYKFLP
ncbi:putative bifunctional diguanylate cyclase/phosphodiesterase [Vibrio penaeicida]|uniref:putative bifunctional diguanylate cyclase/phosphodiesterase n=1 Tax=Vibrio penaeicida TaxID=104609 RepID=UPI000F82BF90|nr:EAL domain-containing protein [Vibrio penaeicida]RTZ19183.1 EAL domain-containing protein [Vibrio penaeicida]